MKVYVIYYSCKRNCAGFHIHHIVLCTACAVPQDEFYWVWSYYYIVSSYIADEAMYSMKSAIPTIIAYTISTNLLTRCVCREFTAIVLTLSQSMLVICDHSGKLYFEFWTPED